MTKHKVGICNECGDRIWIEEGESADDFIHIEGEGIWHTRCYEKVKERSLID